MLRTLAFSALVPSATEMICREKKRLKISVPLNVATQTKTYPVSHTCQSVCLVLIGGRVYINSKFGTMKFNSTHAIGWKFSVWILTTYTSQEFFNSNVSTHYTAVIMLVETFELQIPWLV